MITAREDSKLVGLYLIDQAMFPVNPSGPTPFQFMFQRFGFADASERFSLNFPDQSNNTKSLRPIMFHPPREVLERCDSQIPSFATVSSSEKPCWRSFASRRRRFIVSDLRRYAVSRSDSISRHNEIGTITAVGSPLSLETYWISTSINYSVLRFSRPGGRGVGRGPGVRAHLK